MKIATIGVYGWTAATFLDALRDAGVRTVADVRQRRGVRGSHYAWANVGRLQAVLTEAGIGYHHHKELAPTTELRQLQYAEDERLGVGKGARAVLAAAYRERYTAEILDRADLHTLLGNVPAALLCVEREPAACHRSLIAQRIASDHGLDVLDLLP